MPMSLRCVFALPLLLLCMGTALADDSRWVRGGWVGLREAPVSGAAIVGFRQTNSRVRLLSRNSDDCRVDAGDGLAGYLPCAELLERPLRLDDLPADQRESLTAFWLAPTMERFATIARGLESGRLTEAQQAAQQKSQKPLRFPLADFDAMKRRLQQGLLPDFSDAEPRVELGQLHAATRGRSWWIDSVADALGEVLTPQLLPPAKPSLFRQPSEVLLAYTATVDGIAAMLPQPSSVRFSGRPEWLQTHYNEGFTGLWDIGEVEVGYAQPVVLHAVGRNGLVSAGSVAGGVVTGFTEDEDSCADGYPGLPEPAPLAGYPQVHESIAVFYLRTPLPARKARIVTRRLQLAVRRENGNDTTPADFLLHGIDLDADGTADLVSLEGRRKGDISGEDVSDFSYFANIAGRWWLAGYAYYSECT